MKNLNLSPVVPTNTAHSSAPRIDICIISVVRMASLATGFCRVNLRNSLSSIASYAVFSMGNGLKMVCVYTRWVATQVVNFLIDRYFPEPEFIGKPVSANASPFALFNHGKAPISLLVFSGRPYPATTRLVNFVPKPIFRWSTFIIHRYILPRLTTKVKGGE